MVRPLIVLVVALAASACASSQRNVASREERAKAVALRYLTEHHIAIPRGGTTSVEDGVVRSDFAPPQRFYWVHIQVRRGGALETVYDIWVDPNSWKARLFTDRRATIPSRA